MLKFSKKNNLQRSIIKKYEQGIRIQKILTILLANKDFPSKTVVQKYLLNLKQFFTPSNSSSRLRSSCMLTGRTRSIYRNFKMSRIKIREYANGGFFVGMSKSS
jgi:small subunit ribosomal protein S14